ncbi:MAG: DHH family phosphoesterase [Thermoplasmata archaeon]|nr:MAG: DHH family phosphoesterase [Thermoplasmata archaeon]
MKLKDTVPEGLLQKLESAKKIVLEQKDTIRVVSHYDADGICAAGVLCHALLRKNMKFHVKLTTSLKGDYIALLKEDDYETTIFCDMGSNNLPALSDLSKNVIILDHHKPKEDSGQPLLVNPHFFGMDGTYEVCASSLAFMFALVLDEGNWDLSALALAGIIGDKQHIAGLSGFNEFVVATAEEKGFVDARDTLKISGKNLRTSLLEGLDPFLVGISGREEKVLEFLKKMKLKPDSRLEEMDEDQ